MPPCSHSSGVPSAKPSDVRTEPGVTAETREVERDRVGRSGGQGQGLEIGLTGCDMKG